MSMRIKTWFAIGALAAGVLALAAPRARALQAAVTKVTVPIQGTLSDPAGTPLNGPQQIRFDLYAAATGGTSLLNETQVVTVTDGDFTVFLGDITNITTTVLNGQALYLGVTVGSDPEMTPRMRLGYVPYAAWATTANTLGTLTQADVCTGVIAGTGLSGGGNGGTPTLTANTTYLQRRVTGGTACTTTQAIRTVNADGTVVCTDVPQGVITDLTAGSGVTITNGTTANPTISADTAYMQRRVTGGTACTATQAIRTVASDGTVACSDIPQLVQGSGISITGTTSPTIAVATGGVTNAMMASGQDAAKITTGTLDDARFSAWSNLQSEKHMLAGTVSVVGNGSSFVSFGITFAHVPKVIVTADSGATTTINTYCMTYLKTQTSFFVNCQGTAASVSWIAID